MSKSETNPKSKIKSQKLGTKVEIKNLNSFRSVEQAINHEIERQTEALEAKEKIVQETRGWDEGKGITVSQREKEEAHDYRYLPEPDLPELHFDKKFIQTLKAELPELPQQRKERFAKEYELDVKTIELFCTNKDLGEYFEQVVSELRNWTKEAAQKEKVSRTAFLKLAKVAANYITSDLLGMLKGASVTDANFRITPENFAEFATLIQRGTISSKIAKQVLAEMLKTGGDPSHIIEEKGLSQMSDEGELETIIKDVIAKNDKVVQDYKKGKENALQFLVGQVMAATKGRAKPDVVQKLLKELLF